MKAESVYEQLYAYSKTLAIVDTHEHFISEEWHVNRYLSFFDYLMSYVQWDMYSAGMPASLLRQYPQDEGQAEEMFRILEPFWKLVKYGSYARPVRLSLQHFHGVDDLTPETIRKIGAELNAANRPGHYEEVFSQTRICRIINQSLYGETGFGAPRFVHGIVKEEDPPGRIRQFWSECPDGTYAEYLEWTKGRMQEAARAGCVLKKFFADGFLTPPDRKTAMKDFELLRRGQEPSAESPLYSVILHDQLDICGELGLVAAVHTGVWGDIGKLSPLPLFAVAEQHPGTVFDVYHMGMPFVRECAFLGKNYPHVYLNLCWSHCVSEQISRQAVGEWLDLVPVSKIFGFGGDVITLPEQVWGQLEHALQNLCRILADRILLGRMDLEYAQLVLKLWLHDSPARVYKLSV